MSLSLVPPFPTQPESQPRLRLAAFGPPFMCGAGGHVMAEDFAMNRFGILATAALCALCGAVRSAGGVRRLAGGSVAKDLDGTTVRVASIPHLIDMKRRAGRPRDLEDIGKLQQILDEGTGQGDDAS